MALLAAHVQASADHLALLLVCSRHGIHKMARSMLGCPLPPSAGKQGLCPKCLSDSEAFMQADRALTLAPDQDPIPIPLTASLIGLG